MHKNSNQASNEMKIAQISMNLKENLLNVTKDAP